MRLKKQIAMYTGVAAMAAAALGGVPATAAACNKVASPQGSDAYPGTTASPYATVEHLANSLSPGQTGCVRAGVYQNDVRIERGGTGSAPTAITSYPGERATILGRLEITDDANHVVIQSLNLDGRATSLPSPSVYGDGIVFRGNDVTNGHTNICFILGSNSYGRARGTVIEGNHIHNCGEMPATNHHHGIYAEASDGARITDNWIYDNADRGVQLFPDAQGTYVARNVIDGNGQGVLFSRTSANNVVENNIISNPALRYNLEDFELSGGGNVARRNCVWSTRDARNPGGIQPGIGVPVLENLVIDPGFVNRGGKDFRLKPGSPCLNMAAGLQPKKAKKRKQRRPVRLRAATRAVWPGGRLRLRAKVKSPSARAAASRKAVLKVRVGRKWRRVAAMRLRGVRYVAKPHLGTIGRRAAREFGMTRVRRHGRLKLRAHVPGVGRSNVLRVRIGK
ncbi:MAG TPA: right-handed parallel beta-helix repeat-containing protein [Solirubrobacterales bacterium]|nr:right-handed parallel beta-helix repeat-containing protein [Solirubrobacterales bacterium]